MAVTFTRVWAIAASTLLVLVIMAPTPALGQAPPAPAAGCDGVSCLDMLSYFNTLCTWLANTQATIPQAQYDGNPSQVNSCQDVNLLQSRQSNPGIFQAFPQLQGQGLRIVPLPFNATTDMQIQNVQESVATSSAVEIVNANAGSVSMAYTNSISTSTSATFSHSTTSTSNTGWQVGININLPFELGGISAQYSNSMSWTSMDTSSSTTSNMVSSGTTDTITVNGGECVYVMSQVLTSQASGAYTLAASLEGLVGMYMGVPANGGFVWNWQTPAQWFSLAHAAGYAPVGAESSIGGDGVMRLTSPFVLSSQRGIINVVPMDPNTCKQKIAAAQAAIPSTSAPNGSNRKLLSAEPLQYKPVMRDVQPEVLQTLKAKFDRKISKVVMV